MKILIVDDEEYKLKLYSMEFKEEFKDEGHDILTARDGDEALRIFDSQHIDLVTLDITMRTATEGIDTMRLMKERNPRIPIIMLTAYDYRDDFQTWAADAYIVKSSDLGELKSVIRSLLPDS